MPENDPPPPLNYHPYRVLRGETTARALRYFGGLLLAMFVVAVIGCLGFPFLQRPHPFMRRYIVGFALVAITAGVALAVAFLKGDKERRRWFLLGLLTGLCVSALLEGLCFANP